VQVTPLDHHRSVEHDEHPSAVVTGLGQHLSGRHLGHPLGGHQRGGLRRHLGEERDARDLGVGHGACCTRSDVAVSSPAATELARRD